MKAIMVDDELSARMTMRTILNQFFKEVIIIGEADEPEEAIDLIKKLKPDLVFLDIQMRTGSGFMVMDAFTKPTFQVIFVSAHKQHAYDSFRHDATDYLLKPLRIKDLRAALDKVKENMKDAPEPEEKVLLRYVSQEQFKVQLVVPEIEGFSVIQLSEIVRVEGSRNYTHFFLNGDKRATASKSIKDFEDLLVAHGFLRIHKSHIINLYHLSRYIKGRGGEVIMSDGAELPVARDRRDALIDAFLKAN